MRRLLCVAAMALAAASCGGSAAQQPTPRPAGQRGTLLNPIDRTRSTVNQQNQQTSQNEQRFGGEYEQGNPPP